MRLVVTGATGFIGTALTRRLLQQGHELTLFTRGSPPDASTGSKKWLHWTPGTLRGWDAALEGADGVINLAGEPIAAKKWTSAQRRRIEKSRIDATYSLVQACAKARQKPKVFISASAVGYYGPRNDELITEESSAGNDFLGQLCSAWEAEAFKATELGIRVVCPRIGIVLGPGGGALRKMAGPFKYFVGGTLGTGKQWMSWIHLEDVVGLINRFLDDGAIQGAVNTTAPNPVRNHDFCAALAKVLNRPCWARVPAFALKLALGDLADMLLTGQRVIPTAAEKFGYRFRYRDLEPALQACQPL
ncbi:MAG TPA: TIGR01777 family oxidoreductase [Candidatus Binatia bacterium]|jgi:hypothetical protein